MRGGGRVVPLLTGREPLSSLHGFTARLPDASESELFLQEGADLASLQAAPIVEALKVAFTMLSAELDRSRKAASRWLGDPGDPSAED